MASNCAHGGEPKGGGALTPKQKSVRIDPLGPIAWGCATSMRWRSSPRAAQQLTQMGSQWHWQLRPVHHPGRVRGATPRVFPCLFLAPKVLVCTCSPAHAKAKARVAAPLDMTWGLIRYAHAGAQLPYAKQAHTCTPWQQGPPRRPCFGPCTTKHMEPSPTQVILVNSNRYLNYTGSWGRRGGLEEERERQLTTTHPATPQ